MWRNVVLCQGLELEPDRDAILLSLSQASGRRGIQELGRKGVKNNL